MHKALLHLQAAYGQAAPAPLYVVFRLCTARRRVGGAGWESRPPGCQPLLSDTVSPLSRQASRDKYRAHSTTAARSRRCSSMTVAAARPGSHRVTGVPGSTDASCWRAPDGARARHTSTRGRPRAYCHGTEAPFALRQQRLQTVPQRIRPGPRRRRRSGTKAQLPCRKRPSGMVPLTASAEHRALPSAADRARCSARQACGWASGHVAASSSHPHAHLVRSNGESKYCTGFWVLSTGDSLPTYLSYTGLPA